MRSCAGKWGRARVTLLRSWWANHRVNLLRLAVALMTLAGILRLRNEFSRLLWEPGRSGAIDLKIFHNLVHRWFAGKPIYSELRSAKYPPASYAILWPLLGWLEVTPARWVWAATTVPALGWLAYLTVKGSAANTRLERGFMALLPLSMYATSAAIGNGQLIVHLLPMLVAGLLLLTRERRRYCEELLAAALILLALVKPSVSAPFFWIALFVPGQLWPALLISTGYLALTLLAALFQEPGLWSLLHGWLARSSADPSPVWAYANLHTWLSGLGLNGWLLPSALLALLILGLWTYSHRRSDIWLLMGVAALVARFWTYHLLYDDLLILLPMVALFRIAKRGPSTDGSDVAAGVLLAITWCSALAPARLRFFPPPWGVLFDTGQTIVWLLVLIFLVGRGWREETTGVGS